MSFLDKLFGKTQRTITKTEYLSRIGEYKSKRNVKGLIRILEEKNIDYDLVEMVREALMGLGMDAMLALSRALGDSQRIAGMNQLQREGRLNDTILKLGIGKAVSDYRREFE